MRTGRGVVLPVAGVLVEQVIHIGTSGAAKLLRHKHIISSFPNIVLSGLNAPIIANEKKFVNTLNHFLPNLASNLAIFEKRKDVFELYRADK